MSHFRETLLLVVVQPIIVTRTSSFAVATPLQSLVHLWHYWFHFFLCLQWNDLLFCVTYLNCKMAINWAFILAAISFVKQSRLVSNKRDSEMCSLSPCPYLWCRQQHELHLSIVISCSLKVNRPRWNLSLLFSFLDLFPSVSYLSVMFWIPVTIVLFVGTGLKCRTCSGEGGLCSSVTDNGDSVECTGEQDACWFWSTRK